MYEYKIIKVELSKIGTVTPKEDYHRIIDEYASRGWRLVQLFVPPVGVYGVAKYIEIIFEREECVLSIESGSSLIIRINYWAKWLKSAIIKSIKALRWYENEKRYFSGFKAVLPYGFTKYHISNINR